MSALRLTLIRETAGARLFARADGHQKWVPRSVCRSTVKFPREPGQPQVCEVEIEEWWLEKAGWANG
jgi:hypothetical protein